MTDDIVAELDRWREWYTTDPEAIAVIERARDEIVALRKDRDALFAAMDERGPAIRAEALDEAAHACEAVIERGRRVRDQTHYAELCVIAIRALKDKP